MADQVQEILEVPSEFAKDGIQFIRRCTKRPYSPLLDIHASELTVLTFSCS